MACGEAQRWISAAVEGVLVLLQLAGAAVEGVGSPCWLLASSASLRGRTGAWLRECASFKVELRNSNEGRRYSERGRL